jgi:hypothetical protein
MLVLYVEDDKLTVALYIFLMEKFFVTVALYIFLMEKFFVTVALYIFLMEKFFGWASGKLTQTFDRQLVESLG